MHKAGNLVSGCPLWLYHYSRGGTRTPDPVINSHLLYHLSYSGRARKLGDISYMVND